LVTVIRPVGGWRPVGTTARSAVVTLAFGLVVVRHPVELHDARAGQACSRQQTDVPAAPRDGVNKVSVGVWMSGPVDEFPRLGRPRP